MMIEFMMIKKTSANKTRTRTAAKMRERFFRAGSIALGVMVFMVFAPQRSEALQFTFYDMEIFVDTTVSAGVSIRTAKRDKDFLSEANGGPAERRREVARTYINFGDTTPGGTAYVPGTTAYGNINPASSGVSSIPRFQIYNNDVPANFDDSISTDDSRLNFDQGDLISAPIKMTSDILVNVGDYGIYGNYTIFGRISAFYDEVLGRDETYERFGEDNTPAKRLLGRDIEILDGYISGDYDVLGEALNLRAGQQVISWGESTFYLGGVNVVNPIDVSAFRRPGSEVKDVLLPENAFYASLSLPYNLNVEGYYLLEWNPFELEPPGSPFQNNDTIRPRLNQIQDRLYLSGSATTGTYRNNCFGSPARHARYALDVAGTTLTRPGLALPDLPGYKAGSQPSARTGVDQTVVGSCAWAFETQDDIADGAGGDDGQDLRDLATAIGAAYGATPTAGYQAAVAGFAGAGAAAGALQTYLGTADAAVRTAQLGIFNGVAADDPQINALSSPTDAQVGAALAAVGALVGTRQAGLGAARAGVQNAINAYNDRHFAVIGSELTNNINHYQTNLYSFAGGNAERVHRNPRGTNPLGLFPDPVRAVLPQLASESENEWATRVGNSREYTDYYLNRVTQLNTMPITGEVDAKDDGQYGFAVRWYSEYFGDTEFGLYYQNYHSRRPVAEVFYYETPIVTLTTTGFTSSTGAALNGLGCYIGAALMQPTIGFLVTGNFLDRDLEGYRETTDIGMHLGINAQGMREMNPRQDPNPDSFRLELDPAHFREPGLQTQYWDVDAGAQTMDDRVLAGLGDFLKYADYADQAFNAGAMRAEAAGQAAVTALLAATPGADAAMQAAAYTAAALPLATFTAGRFAARAGALAGVDMTDAAAVAAALAPVNSEIQTSVRENGPNRYDVARINCALALSQVPLFSGDSFSSNPAAPNLDGSAAPFSAVAGSEWLAIQHRNQYRFHYPEDIKSLGFSFATTFGDWGVQGEIAYRMDQPLQIDVTEQVITAAGLQAIAVGLGDAARFSLTPLGTQNVRTFVPNADNLFTTVGATPGANPGDDPIPTVDAIYVGAGLTQRVGDPEGTTGSLVRQGIIKANSAEYVDVISAQVAFTNTFPRSNGFVDSVGADLGILLINVAMEHVIDMPGSRNPAARPVEKRNTLQSVCRAGTEAPLGAILNLDIVTDHSCSPDETSFGYTLFGNLQYNSFYGTAWQVVPFIALRHDIFGNTPAPLNTFRKDRVAVTLGVNAEFQSTWRLSLAYTDFFGEEDYQFSGDRDFVAFSLSYSF